MAPADAHGCVVRILPWKELLSNFWENRLKIGALGWASNLCVDVLKVISKLPFFAFDAVRGRGCGYCAYWHS